MTRVIPMLAALALGCGSVYPTLPPLEMTAPQGTSTSPPLATGYWGFHCECSRS